MAISWPQTTEFNSTKCLNSVPSLHGYSDDLIMSLSGVGDWYSAAEQDFKLH